MKVYDIEYMKDGLFVTFFPNTKEGISVWETMEKNGGRKILAIHTDSVIQQIIAAGYSVKKAKPIKSSGDDILADLLKSH